MILSDEQARAVSEALSFYPNPRHYAVAYPVRLPGEISEVARDMGERAREVVLIFHTASGRENATKPDTEN
jgi:hypothetical protein